MPTENRSSNTEMVSVPPYIGLEPLVGRYYPAQCRRCGWVGSSEELTEDDAQCTRDIGDRLCLGDCDELERHDLLNIIQAMTAPQPHPDPIAWMVGTAFWWTKEEAERDAADTGLPIVGLGPMVGVAPAEQHQGEPVARVEVGVDRNACLSIVDNDWLRSLKDKATHQVVPLYTHADPAEVERLESERAEQWRLRRDAEADRDTKSAVIAELRAQLADREHLAAEAAYYRSTLRNVLKDIRDDIARGGLAPSWIGVAETISIVLSSARAAHGPISASAEPSAPTWSCQPCQVEQPTDRSCDACGGQTQLIAAKS